MHSCRWHCCLLLGSNGLCVLLYVLQRQRSRLCSPEGCGQSSLWMDGITGWAENAVAGLKVAFDTVTSRPTDANSSLTQQIKTAAMSQGLLGQVPAPGFAQAGAGAFAGQQGPGGYAGQQGGVLAAGAATVAQPQLLAPQILPPQFLQQQMLPHQVVQPQVVQPQVLQPQYVLPQYGQAGGQGGPQYGAAPRPLLCWRCGVTGHTVPECRHPFNPANPTPFKPAGRAGRRG